MIDPTAESVNYAAARHHRLQRHKPYPAYKDSGVEWLGEIPAHWEVKRLKHIATSNDDALPDRTDPAFELTYVDISSVDEVEGITRKEAITFGAAPSRARRIVRDGDIIISTVRTYLRAIASIVNPETNLIVSTGFAVIRPRFIDSSFAAYAVRALYFVESVVANSMGVSYPAINANELVSLAVSCPSDEEQRAIAGFLDRETGKIDSLVANKQRLIELLREKRVALINRAVTKGLDPDVRMEDSGVEWLGEIPAHWELRNLSQVTECLDNLRIPLNAEERGRMQGNYPYWGANSIVDYVDDWLFDEELVLIGEDGAPFFDIDRAVAFRVTGKIWVNNHAHVLRPKEQIVASFLAEVLNCVDYRAFIDGTTRDKLTQGDMNAISIQLPPPEEQRAIAAFLERETAKIDVLVAKVREAIDRLKELRAALISAAVTGKIDVRDSGTMGGKS